MSAQQDRTIEDVLDEARQQAGMSWQQLADRAGITASGLRRIRIGEAQPRTGTRHGIELALGLEPDDLAGLFGEDAPEEALTWDDVKQGLRVKPAPEPTKPGGYTLTVTNESNEDVTGLLIFVDDNLIAQVKHTDRPEALRHIRAVTESILRGFAASNREKG